MQQQMVGSALQKKQLCFEGICSVEQVPMKCPSAEKQVTGNPPAGNCFPLPTALCPLIALSVNVVKPWGQSWVAFAI